MVEEFNIAYHTINMSLSSALQIKTPNERWWRSPNDYSYLKVFGFLAYMHVIKDKLGARPIKCLFLGCLEGTN